MEQVVALVAIGALLAAKVSTRMLVVLGGYDHHVICVYTRDWGNEPKSSRLGRCCVALDFQRDFVTSETATPSPASNVSSTKADSPAA